MELYKAEVPGPTPEKLTPRVQQTALLLWEVYILLTAAETLLLMGGGMGFFDALVHSFSTVATGGFSTKNASVAWFGSAYIEWVITFFMFAAGVNFTLHYLFLTGLWRKALRDEELRFYLKLSAGAALVVAAVLYLDAARPGDLDLEGALRAGAFQVMSFLTTTGFVSENYNYWPYFAQFLLMLLAFVGGCAGSTSGGLKNVRVMLLARSIHVEVESLLHPRSVLHTRVNGKAVSPRALNAVLAFFTLYIIILVLASLLVTALGGNQLDAATALSGMVASLANVGPGLGKLGAVENYAWLPASVKWIFCFCMLAGRLEIYAVLLLFVPSTWRR
jgi:trk system potassium uptake protein TrkH